MTRWSGGVDGYGWMVVGGKRQLGGLEDLAGLQGFGWLELCGHGVSLWVGPSAHAENIRCGGNDLGLGFYAAEWGG